MRKNLHKVAIELVKKYEHSQRHKVREVKRKDKMGCDLLVDGWKRIEVKTRIGKPPNQILIYDTVLKYLKSKEWGDRAYYIYVVYNLEKNPKLKIIKPKDTNKKENWNKHKICILKAKRILKKEKSISLKKINTKKKN